MPATAIIAALSVQSRTGGHEDLHPLVLGGPLRDGGAQPAVRGDAAGEHQPLELEAARGAERLLDQGAHDRLLVARAQVRERPPLRHAVAPDVVEERGLEPREAEVEVRALHDRLREPVDPRVALLREPVDGDAARVRQAEELRALVERLARGVVARLPEEPVVAEGVRRVERGVAAGDDEAEVRERRRGRRRGTPPRGAPRGGSRGRAACPTRAASAFADLHADEERADEPRPARHRDRVERAGATPARESASSTTGITCTTWFRLASSGTTPPQRRWISICVATTSESDAPAVLDDGGRRLVARRLDAEDLHGEESTSGSAQGQADEPARSVRGVGGAGSRPPRGEGLVARRLDGEDLMPRSATRRQHAQGQADEPAPERAGGSGGPASRPPRGEGLVARRLDGEDLHGRGVRRGGSTRRGRRMSLPRSVRGVRGGRLLGPPVEKDGQDRPRTARNLTGSTSGRERRVAT